MIEGELYKRLPKGILSRCINKKEGRLRLEELHSQIYGIVEKMSLYRKMQRMGHYWPNMNKEAATIHEECQRCRLSVDKEESYACIFDGRLEDPIRGILGSREHTN